MLEDRAVEWTRGDYRAHPDLPGLWRIALLTRDAPSLYERAGFVHGAGDRHSMERIAAPGG